MKFASVLMVMLLAGCANPSDDGKVYHAPETIKAEQAYRFEVVSYQSFQDTSAYSETRSIVLIRDKQTGEEYVAISGAGVVERGSHQAGKVRIADEK